MTEKTTNDLEELDIKTFVELGLLQEINRLILHPIGMALKVDVDKEGEYTLGGVVITDDPKGIVFTDEKVSSEGFQRKCEQLDSLRNKAKTARMEKLGYFVQPRYL